MATIYNYIFLVLLYSCSVSANEEAVSKGQRRFLFDFVYDCKHCYQCACKFQRCPNFNAWEYAGAYTQCAFTLHNLNCQANFHQDGGWTVWSQWSECQGYCSIPSRKRTRACTNPKPFNCGKKCNGTDTEYDTSCIPQHCLTSANSSLLVGTTSLSNTSTFTTSMPRLQTLSTSSYQSSQQSTSSSASSPTTVHNNANTASVSSGTTSSRSNPAMVTQTTPATVTQTTPAMATPTRPAPLLEDFGSCDTYCTLNSLLTKNQAIDDKASICPDGSHAGGDTLLMKCCNVTASSQWTLGKKIDGNCDSVPRYSPVASFFFGNSVRGTSGIFVGCSQDAGFQMIRQECNDTSQVVSVTPEQTRFPAPDTYYVVESLSS